MNQFRMELIRSFTSRTGQVIRVGEHHGEPIFCAKDLCRALGIVNHRLKVGRLDEDEKLMYVEHTSGQRRSMLYVTEAGMYKVILTCRGATTKGTPAHAFTRWVTHHVLPSMRRQRERDREYQLRETLAIQTREEKTRRLWFVLKDMDVWSYNIRRKYFGRVCGATKHLCYVDEVGSPHVMSECLEECKDVIRRSIGRAILDQVPPNQNLLTRYWN